MCILNECKKIRHSEVIACFRRRARTAFVGALFTLGSQVFAADFAPSPYFPGREPCRHRITLAQTVLNDWIETTLRAEIAEADAILLGKVKSVLSRADWDCRNEVLTLQRPGEKIREKTAINNRDERFPEIEYSAPIVNGSVLPQELIELLMHEALSLLKIENDDYSESNRLFTLIDQEGAEKMMVSSKFRAFSLALSEWGMLGARGQTVSPLKQALLFGRIVGSLHGVKNLKLPLTLALSEKIEAQAENLRNAGAMQDSQLNAKLRELRSSLAVELAFLIKSSPEALNP